MVCQNGPISEVAPLPRMCCVGGAEKPSFHVWKGGTKPSRLESEPEGANHLHQKAQKVLKGLSSFPINEPNGHVGPFCLGVLSI
jgi:hypothetical protein